MDSFADNVTARQSLPPSPGGYGGTGALPAGGGIAAGNSGGDNGVAGTHGKASQIYLGANSGAPADVEVRDLGAYAGGRSYSAEKCVRRQAAADAGGGWTRIRFG